MSLLSNLISQVAQDALTSQEPTNSNLIGNVLSGAFGEDKSNLAGMIGGVLGGQLNNSSDIGAMLGNVLGNEQTSKQGMLMAVLVPMALKWIQNNGGLSGALSQVNSLGLDKYVKSWMSTETENINLDDGQITQLFGEEKIKEAAEKVGVESNIVSQGLASLLPEVINQLTPEGGIEQEEQANQEINNILGEIQNFL